MHIIVSNLMAYEGLEVELPRKLLRGAQRSDDSSTTNVTSNTINKDNSSIDVIPVIVTVILMIIMIIMEMIIVVILLLLVMVLKVVITARGAQRRHEPPAGLDVLLRGATTLYTTNIS